MKKFEFNKEINYFCIDPLHLTAGFKEAEGKYVDICVQPMDGRSKNLDVDVGVLISHTEIKRLYLHRDLTIPKGEFKKLERLVNVEVLSLKEVVPLDYGKFHRLQELVLTKGTDLPGLERVPSLKLLYLGLWNREVLPNSIGSIAATSVRISASKKLRGIEPLCSLDRLTSLMMQDLPALKVGNEINGLKSLDELHVEKSGWTDLSRLRLDSLRKLFVSTVESLKFITQLKNLEDLFFWDCVDGDLSPILNHPKLKRIRFAPEKKHYSHKLAELQRVLATKHGGKA